jgi:hypothetical protein
MHIHSPQTIQFTNDDKDDGGGDDDNKSRGTTTKTKLIFSDIAMHLNGNENAFSL